MILIVTYKEDYTADFLISSLNQQGREYLRLNTEDIEQYGYETTNDLDFLFKIECHRQFEAVWYRRLKLPNLNNASAIDDYLASEYEYLFSNVFRSVAAKRWMSDPDAIIRAENKVLQLKLATSLGFSVPKTLVTNRKERVKEFAERVKMSGLIVKPLFSGRIESINAVQLIYTSEVSSSQLASIDLFDLTPCIFQEKVSKAYELRVTVIGNKVFAARVDSQANPKTRVDWRRERLDFIPYALPQDMAEKCRTLVHSLNTNFGAIDLIRSTDGQYYFLENNPNGQWAWIEMDTGMPLRQAIIDFLYE